MKYSGPFLLPSRALLSLLAALLLLATACSKESDNVYADLQQHIEDVRKADEVKIQQYLADNKITNFQRQSSGLYVVMDSTGTGALPKAGQRVKVRYLGTFLDGRKFDSSASTAYPDPFSAQNTPYPFTLGAGQVIQGWDEGIALLPKGTKATLLVPSILAYGPYGTRDGVIPPDTPIMFKVQLVDIL